MAGSSSEDATGTTASEIALRLGGPPEAGRVSADVVRTADGRCGETRAGEGRSGGATAPEAVPARSISLVALR